MTRSRGYKRVGASLREPDWLPPHSAARVLGLTLRQLERAVAEGVVRRRALASGAFLVDVSTPVDASALVKKIATVEKIAPVEAAAPVEVSAPIKIRRRVIRRPRQVVQHGCCEHDRRAGECAACFLIRWPRDLTDEERRDHHRRTIGRPAAELPRRRKETP